jgi:tetratricopeptide (TPR) repeat protein
MRSGLREFANCGGKPRHFSAWAGVAAFILVASRQSHLALPARHMNDMTDATHLTDPEASEPDELLARAIACHQAWDFEGAEALYRAVLEAVPGHGDANHNLGVLLAIQRAQPAAALPFFEAALNADSGSPQHWFSYIDALIRDGQHGMAGQLLPLAQAHGLQASMANALAERHRHRARASRSIPPTSMPWWPCSRPATMRAARQWPAD